MELSLPAVDAVLEARLTSTREALKEQARMNVLEEEVCLPS